MLLPIFIVYKACNSPNGYSLASLATRLLIISVLLGLFNSVLIEAVLSFTSHYQYDYWKRLILFEAPTSVLFGAAVILWIITTRSIARHMLKSIGKERKAEKGARLET